VWDSTQGDAWAFTPFEKALYDTFGYTRFSTDDLTPNAYSWEDLETITETLLAYTLPAITETLRERKAVIAEYDRIKDVQCKYMFEEV
jgi:hypothetical protein